MTESGPTNGDVPTEDDGGEADTIAEPRGDISENGNWVEWQPKGAGRMLGLGCSFTFHVDRIPSERRDADVRGGWELYRMCGLRGNLNRTWIGNYRTLADAQKVAESIDKGGIHYYPDREAA